MSLIWTLNRLRAMSLPEVAHRVREKALKASARRQLEGWDLYQNDGPVPMQPWIRSHVAAFDAPCAEVIAQAARTVLQGTFCALGRDWPTRAPSNLFPADLWRLDPVTGKLWPGAGHYCFDIAYRHQQSLGDVKYVWELNRLQFLQPLAAYFCLTGDRAALAAVEGCLESWYEANPPFRGLGWACGIEVALRAISLLVVSSLCAQELSPASIVRMRALLAASLVWLNRYPSRFSSANNHLIAEAAAQYLICLAMPDLPSATAHRAKARYTLEEEATRQFHADGVPAEQSPSYGAFSAELLFLCHNCGRLDGKVAQRLQAFAQFIFWLADEQQRVPAIGDNDEGRVLAFKPYPAYPYHVASSILAPTSQHGMRVFRDGGYSTVRDGRWHVVFDHGPLGYLSIAAHGHADALAVCINLDGQALFVDPGTYLYHAGGTQRDWLRGTPAHNTLSIAGEDQSRISGPFNWSHKAQARLDEVIEGDAWSITASHDGYENRHGVRHQRRVAAHGDGLLIEDRLLGAPQRAQIVFQLAPRLSSHVQGDRCHIMREGQPIAHLLFEAPGLLSCEESLVSPSFGVRRYAPRLVWQGDVGEQGTRIHLSPA